MFIVRVGAQNSGRPAVPFFELEDDEYVIEDGGGITLRRVEGTTGGYASSFSDQITFYGRAWELIRDELIDAPNARTNVVKVEIYDDCCGDEPRLVYRGKITADDLEWCEISDGKEASCAFKVTTQEDQIDNDQEICVRSKIIQANVQWPDGTLFWYRRHPYVKYCNEIRPSTIQILLFIFGGLLAIVCFYVFLIVDIILRIVNTVLDIIGFIKKLADLVGLGDALPDIGAIDLDKDKQGRQLLTGTVVREDMPRLITGCGNGHPAPLVRDYLTNVCLQCGLNGLSSSILNNPGSIYYNMALFHAPTKEGRRQELYVNGNIVQNIADIYFNYNAPIETGGEMLDKLAPLFNAEWFISNDQLVFEATQVDYTLWADFTTPEAINDIIELCFEFSDDLPPRGLNLKYTLDGFDGTGNEALFLYNDVVPFDQPPTQALGPLASFDFLFSSARFRNDGIDPDKITTWSAFFTVIKALTFTTVDINGQGTGRFMILQRGCTTIPKLLILEDNYDEENAKVINVSRTAAQVPYEDNNGRDLRVYNWPMWFAARHYGGRYINSDPVETRKYAEFANLFQFWQSLDPREQQARRGQQFRLVMAKSCQFYQPLLDLLENRNLRLTVLIPYQGGIATGYVTSIEVDSDFFTVSGTL